jgi:hypothetical protein
MKESVPPFACELVLLENEQESREKRTFLAALSPGTHVHIESRDWIVLEIRDRAGAVPEVICRPAEERR